MHVVRQLSAALSVVVELRNFRRANLTDRIVRRVVRLVRNGPTLALNRMCRLVVRSVVTLIVPRALVIANLSNWVFVKAVEMLLSNEAPRYFRKQSTALKVRLSSVTILMLTTQALKNRPLETLCLVVNVKSVGKTIESGRLCMLERILLQLSVRFTNLPISVVRCSPVCPPRLTKVVIGRLFLVLTVRSNPSILVLLWLVRVSVKQLRTLCPVLCKVVPPPAGAAPKILVVSTLANIAKFLTDLVFRLLMS